MNNFCDTLSILKIFFEHGDMDYIEDFDRIKSVLEYCNDNIKPLHKVQFRGGNEQIIEEITIKIIELFKEKQYIDDDFKPIAKYDNELRKITFFLVLNTDATFKYDLKLDNTIGHMLDVLPQLPKCLLVHIVWGLNLNKYFYEIIKYTPCWFALQFCEPIIQLLKYLKPYELLETIEGVLLSIFKSICRMECRKLDIIDKKIILNKYYDHIVEILRQFYTPDIEKFSEWSKLKFYEYQGFSIKHLLDIITHCFDLFENPILNKRIENKFKMYEICLDVCPYDDNLKAASYQYSSIIEDTLIKIISALLNSLQYNAMLVTISTFTYWVEIDLKIGTNLQTYIGELSYKIIERIEENKKFQHDVVEQLKTIALKPRNIKEIIENAKIGDILHKLDSYDDYNDEIRLWFDELLNRPLALGNDECLDTIKSNIELIKIHNFIKLMDYLKSETERIQKETDSKKDSDIDNDSECDNDDKGNDGDNDDSDANSNNDDNDRNDDDDDCYDYENCREIFEILCKSLKNFNIDELIEIVEYRIKLFGEHELLKTKQYNKDKKRINESLIEFFNKSLENFNQKTFLSLCFENPYLVWQKFFIEACQSEQKIKDFLSTFSVMKKFVSSQFVYNLLLELFPLVYNEKFVTNFIFELYANNVIDRKQFLKEFIYANVKKMLNEEKFTKLLKILKILLMIANKSEFVLNAPILIMAGEIMDQLRWDVITYTDLKDEIVRNCIDFIQIVSKKFLPVANEKDKNWIREKIKLYRPMTQYYFQRYSLTVDEKPKNFDKFLHPNNFIDRNDIDEFLTSTYVRCTTKETEWLARNDELLPHISDVILILNGIISELKNDNAISNYRYCILNYINIINKIILPKMKNDKLGNKELIMKILKIIETSPSDIYDEIFMIFHGILINVFHNASTIIEESFINEVKTAIRSMKDCKGKELFSEKFSVMTVESSV